MNDTITTTYRVVLGDDGATKFRSTDRGAAFKFAREYSETNWAGQAIVKDDHGKLVRFRDGRQDWARK
jgi:hypothetical protein